MEKHITLVAALNIGFGFLGVFIAIFLFIAVAGGGFLSGDQEAMKITLIVGTALAFFFLVTSIPEIIGGFGLLKHKSWARILVIIIACVDLIFIPIGTALGIYALWVLLNEETTQLFAEKSKA
jgi:hypothetical protein